MELSGIEKAALSSGAIIEAIQEELCRVEKLLAGCFCRKETQASAMAWFQGLISKVERKNSWQLAEQAAHENPYAFQYLLGRATWDADYFRDLVRGYALDFMSDRDGYLSIDETGFLKKGKHSAGVGRQYTGTAGRIENAQVGVFLSWATERGRVLIDRELYIPKDWFTDRERCKKAGIPEDLVFRKKPEIAQAMLQRVFDSAFKPAWVLGDEVYGCYQLRAFLESHLQPHVLAIASNYPITIGLNQYKAKGLSDDFCQDDWQRISAGRGSKGERYYDWARRIINSDSPEGWARWLLIRRNIHDNEDVAFYIAFAPDSQPLEAMAKAAGSRWTIEECFEMAKGEVGLDQYEVRSFTGWYRHITFSMLALAFLAKLRWNLQKKEALLLEKKVLNQQMLPFLKSRGLA